ncbi:MAG: hypothetical protein ACYDIC_12650 [Desulfobaccales bacterium]
MPLSLGGIELGQVLALVGLVLLLLSGWRRRQARKAGQASTPQFFREQRWMYAAAYGLIIVGLMLIVGKK